MARSRVIAGFIVLALVALVALVAAWRFHSRAAIVEADRDRAERRFTMLCVGMHGDLHLLKSNLPLYEKHVRLEHRPEVPDPSDAVLDAAGIHLGPLSMLMGASQIGLGTSLKHCLPETSNNTSVQDLGEADTADKARTQIDELLRMLEERYGFGSYAEPSELTDSRGSR